MNREESKKVAMKKLDAVFDTAYDEIEENRDRLIKHVVIASFISGFLGGGVFVGLYILFT